MLNTRICWLIIALLPALAMTQEPEEAPVYAYVTYFVCDPSTESRADEIIKRNYAPHYDAAVESGDISQWSWLVHYMGGEWRRALVLTTSNLDDLLDSAGALGEIIEETTPEAGRVFTEVCDEHVDYIWEATPSTDSSAFGEARGNVGFSAYFECDMGREAEADKIVRESFAPVYNRQIEQGNLVSWGWLQHNVGGQYRRLLAYTAADHKQMLRTRNAIYEELYDRRLRRVTLEFDDICPSHEDYMWDVQIETP